MSHLWLETSHGRSIHKETGQHNKSEFTVFGGPVTQHSPAHHWHSYFIFFLPQHPPSLLSTSYLHRYTPALNLKQKWKQKPNTPPVSILFPISSLPNLLKMFYVCLSPTISYHPLTNSLISQISEQLLLARHHERNWGPKYDQTQHVPCPDGTLACCGLTRASLKFSNTLLILLYSPPLPSLKKFTISSNVLSSFPSWPAPKKVKISSRFWLFMSLLSCSGISCITVVLSFPKPQKTDFSSSLSIAANWHRQPLNCWSQKPKNPCFLPCPHPFTPESASPLRSASKTYPKCTVTLHPSLCHHPRPRPFLFPSVCTKVS